MKNKNIFYNNTWDSSELKFTVPFSTQKKNNPVNQNLS